MKIASRILSLTVITMIATFYMGCKKDDDDKKTEEETQLDKLKSVWTLQDPGGTNDGQDRTAVFPNLVLTLSGNFVQDGIYDYSFTGTRPNPSPWPVNGKWTFGTDKSTQMIRDPGGISETAMTYLITDTNLEISFKVPDGSIGWPGSRTSSVIGDWIFTFTK